MTSEVSTSHRISDAMLSWSINAMQHTTVEPFCRYNHIVICQGLGSKWCRQNQRASLYCTGMCRREGELGGGGVQTWWIIKCKVHGSLRTMPASAKTLCGSSLWLSDLALEPFSCSQARGRLWDLWCPARCRGEKKADNSFKRLSSRFWSLQQASSIQASLWQGSCKYPGYGRT